MDVRAAIAAPKSPGRHREMDRSKRFCRFEVRMHGKKRMKRTCVPMKTGCLRSISHWAKTEGNTFEDGGMVND